MSESYFIFSNGELKRKDNVVRITALDGRFKDIKVEMTRDIYLFGEVSLNTKCLNYLATLKIPVHVFNYYGFYTGTFYPKETNVSGKLFVKQVENYTDNDKRTEIAQLIIDAASSNILRNLRYYQERGKELEEIIEQIKALKKGIFRTQNIEELMGVEGSIRKIYYDSWNIIINQEIDFEKRVKRPPDNMINTMISFLNTLVYTACLSEIYVSQLNPTISYLHSVGDRRFSLSLDLAEIFKPLLADRVIFSLLNKKMITEKDIRRECEELWAKNKYYVLSKSQKAYLEIREYLKEKELDVVWLNEKIQETRDMKESKKDFNNAILHIWGYFKKKASTIEKEALFNILNEYMEGKNNQNAVIEYINTLLKKYPNEYLEKSTLLTGEQYETMA